MSRPLLAPLLAAAALGGLVAPNGFAQPACSPLPPPGGAVVTVTPQQAGSLAGIVAAAASGTTVLLADGTYDLSCGDADYRLAFWTPGVSLRSASGNRDAVVLDGAYLTSELVSIYASNVVIADLTLRRAYDHPVHISGQSSAISGILLHNLRIVDPGQQAIKVNPVGAGYVDAGTIECSSLELTDAGRAQVRDNCYTGGIDAHQARGWIVRRNRFVGFWCNDGLSEHAVHFWRCSRDTLVEQNVILDCARGIGFGLGSTGSCRSYPDDPYPAVGFKGHIDGIIRNNFVAAGNTGLQGSPDGFDNGISLEQAYGARVVHNSVASTQTPASSSIEWRFANSVVQVSNNLAGHQLLSRDGATATLAGNLPAVPSGWFRGLAGGDLHLSWAGQAAVNAGVVLAPGLAEVDIDGHLRQPPPDVGADESDLIFADGFES